MSSFIHRKVDLSASRYAARHVVTVNRLVSWEGILRANIYTLPLEQRGATGIQNQNLFFPLVVYKRPAQPRAPQRPRPIKASLALCELPLKKSGVSSNIGVHCAPAVTKLFKIWETMFYPGRPSISSEKKRREEEFHFSCFIWHTRSLHHLNPINIYFNKWKMQLVKSPDLRPNSCQP